MTSNSGQSVVKLKVSPKLPTAKILSVKLVRASSLESQVRVSVINES